MGSRTGLVARWIAPLIGAGIALGVLFWLYRDLNFELFFATLATAEVGWLVLLAATILGEQLVRGWKWRQILYDLKPVSSWRLFTSILAGYGVGILVPLGISPLVRSWLVARLEGLRMASVLVTAAIERFIDGVVFALLAGFVALATQFPAIEGNPRLGIAAAALLGLAIFSGLLWVLFGARGALAHPDAAVSRLIDWLAAKGGHRLADLRSAIAGGIVWPRARARQAGIAGASVVMKIIAATHFLWAGLAVGIVLPAFDYLFLLVFTGVTLVLARFIRVPGGFFIGAGFALHTLGVPDAPALAMIMFSHFLTIALMVGIGLLVLWRSGISISEIARDARLGQ
ncbi:MAG: lysylphosphatidylglycerol synthase transmembrane domain-containing protein [Alphaproteobacteria bacterium]